MIDLNHTADLLEYVPATIEAQLADLLSAGDPAGPFDLYPANPDERTA
jgi:hypothetical protein